MNFKWIDATKEKPPEGCFVLVDGDYFNTMVVAAWVPRENKRFPWRVSSGIEIDEWSEYTVKYWCNLPNPHNGSLSP